MASKHIGMVEVLTETVYGCVDPATALPVAPTTGWNKLEIADKAQLTQPGDLVTAEYTGLRAGFGGTPAELSGFAGRVRRPGKFSFSTPFRGPHSSNTGLAAVLRTCLEVVNAQATSTDTVTAPSDLTGYMSSHGDRYTIGSIVQAVQNGLNRYYPVTSINAGKVNLGLQPSVALSAGATVRLPHCYGLPSIGTPNGLESVAFRLTGHGWTAICFGCVVTKLTVSMNEAGRTETLSFDVDIAHVELLDAGTPSAHLIPSGAVAVQLGSVISYGAAREFSAEFVNEAEEGTLGVESQTIEISFTRATPGTGETLLARSGAEVQDASVSISLTTSNPAPEFFADAIGRKTRQLMIGFGGGAAGSAGNGGCVYCPSVFQMGDAQKRDSSKDYLRTSLSFGVSAAIGTVELPLIVLAFGA